MKGRDAEIARLRRPRVFFGHGMAVNHRRRPTVELQAGVQAPDFTLAAHTDQKVSLASYRGRRVVVAFMPFAFTGG